MRLTIRLKLGAIRADEVYAMTSIADDSAAEALPEPHAKAAIA